MDVLRIMIFENNFKKKKVFSGIEIKNHGLEKNNSFRVIYSQCTIYICMKEKKITFPNPIYRDYNNHACSRKSFDSHGIVKREKISAKIVGTKRKKKLFSHPDRTLNRFIALRSPTSRRLTRRLVLSDCSVKGATT